MKYITKRPPPFAYTKWCAEAAKSGQDEYSNLKNPEKSVLKDSLLAEQGFLCAYTMRRIRSETSHIEHIKPQSLCRNEERGSDLDYDNLVACYPNEGMERPFRYGAQNRGNIWPANGGGFISPLRRDCESRFRFDSKGVVHPGTGDSVAEAMIELLKLNHESLQDDRKRIINEFLRYPDPLSRAAAERLRMTICERNRDGSFHEFCVAVRDAIDDYIRMLDRRAAKRRYAGKK